MSSLVLPLMIAVLKKSELIPHWDAEISIPTTHQTPELKAAKSSRLQHNNTVAIERPISMVHMRFPMWPIIMFIVVSKINYNSVRLPLLLVMASACALGPWQCPIFRPRNFNIQMWLRKEASLACAPCLTS